MKRRWAVAGLVVCAGTLIGWPFLAKSDELKFQYDGTQHTLTISAEDLWRLLRTPAPIFMPVDPAGIVMGRTALGNVWGIGPDGTVYADGVTITAPSGTAWKTIGADFETVTVATSSTCRYGVGPDKFTSLTLAPGTYKVVPKNWPATPNALDVADPAVGSKKTLDCQVPGNAAATQLTIIGAQVYGKFNGTWSRYNGGQWADASTTPVSMLQP